MEAKKNPAKDVHRYSKAFFMIGLCTSCTIMICAFEWSVPAPKEFRRELPPDILVNLIDPPITKPDQPQSPVVPKQKIVLLIPETIKETSTDPADTTSSVPFIELQTGPYLIPAPEPEPSDTLEFRVVETMPKPVGGYEGFYSTVAKSLQYPRAAVQAQIEGRVFIEFVVSQTGALKDLKVVKGIGYGCDEQAIHVISKTLWEPGKQRGKPVKVRMTLPIVFKMN